jgi:hypothetical protein
VARTASVARAPDSQTSAFREIVREDVMVLGMSLATFTALHVVISLIAIATGLVVAAGMLAGNRLPGWTAVFLVTTVLTTVTGFLFPFT